MDNYISTGSPYSFEVDQTLQCLKSVLQMIFVVFETHFWSN